MSTKENLTIQELELLSQAYIDCRLSILQERELELVLISSDASSPLIDEARALMSITTRMAQISANGNYRKKKKKLILFKYGSIVAAIATIVILVIGFFQSDTANKNLPEIYVCVDGDVVSGEMAQTIANETEDLSMEMLKSVIEEAEKDQRLSTEYLKSLIN